MAVPRAQGSPLLPIIKPSAPCYCSPGPRTASTNPSTSRRIFSESLRPSTRRVSMPFSPTSAPMRAPRTAPRWTFSPPQFAFASSPSESLFVYLAAITTRLGKDCERYQLVMGSGDPAADLTLPRRPTLEAAACMASGRLDPLTTSLREADRMVA